MVRIRGVSRDAEMIGYVCSLDTSYKHRQRTYSDLTITDSMKAAAAIVIASEQDESSPRSQVMSPGSGNEGLEVRQESTDLPRLAW